jgi:hypothetical protein
MKKKVLLIYFQGGLGNQFFQFIVGYILACKNQMRLKFYKEETSNHRKFELDSFPEIKKMRIRRVKVLGIKEKFFLYIFLKIIRFIKKFKIPNFLNLFKNFDIDLFEESPFIFNKNLLEKKINKNITLIGYFQSEKYFSNFRKDVLKLFRFPIIKNKSYINYLNMIKNSNSVAVHIRRGDYFYNLNARLFHGILDQNYYKKAFLLIKKKISNPFFFIFSDDIELVKKNFNFLKKEKHLIIDTKSTIIDLNLMKNCKYFIIANSSYSWWGAWLSLYKEKIVYAPKKWIRVKLSTEDILPNNWIKI